MQCKTLLNNFNYGQAVTQADGRFKKDGTSLGIIELTRLLSDAPANVFDEFSVFPMFKPFKPAREVVIKEWHASARKTPHHRGQC